MIPFDSLSNFEALSTAFQHVKENHGMAGADGVSIKRFEENLDENLERLVHEIKDRSYIPLPLLKIMVDKGNGDSRGLCVPTVRDRVVQTAVLQIIEPILEKNLKIAVLPTGKGIR
ncbi:MAG: hypothetical protein HY787_29680 [Deltaproteobacteria bacterium]|nr:hypothetical protein [Deltaproteobacteria bacterium]